MAVTNKFNGSIDTNIIGITITFSMKIADMMTSLIKDVARLEMNMKVNMVRQVLA
jgi:ABC-type multidrug transport system fused ATPase/permease subunit